MKTNILVNRMPLTGTKALAASFCGALFLVLCAKAAIYLPFTPVPVTMQTFGVMLVAMLLGPYFGMLSVMQYLLFGLAGAPVFAYPAAGPAVFAGPTGGYLVGFVVSAYVIGYITSNLKEKSLVALFIACVAGIVAIYACGYAWLALYLGGKPLPAYLLGIAPFIPGGLAKALLASLVFVKLRR